MLDKSNILNELDDIATYLFETQQNEDMRQYLEHLMEKIKSGDFDIKEPKSD